MDSFLKLQTTKKGKDFWGPPQWGTIHIICYNFKKGTEKELIEYLWLLTYLLPCDYCRKNLAFKLKNYPPTEYIKQGSKGVFLYSYMVHDLANQHITKHNPKTPKYSPQYEEIVERYDIIMKSGAWFSYIWASMHILAATLRQEYASKYKRMLELFCILLPDPVSSTLSNLLMKYPIDPYLRNNSDAFFYSYMLHDIVNKKLGKVSPPYKNVKNYYFSSLGEECNDCKV